MQILERQIGLDVGRAAWVNSLAELILVSGRLKDDDWRDEVLLKRYVEYKRVTKRDTLVESLRGMFAGHTIGINRNPFPQNRLERMYPGFYQFTLWSLARELDISEITAVLNQAFPHFARVTFFNNRIQSVPEIWHIHSMVNLGLIAHDVPGNTIAWSGDEVPPTATSGRPATLLRKPE